MSVATLRPELKDLPQRMRDLPIDKRGYPIPAFVDTVNGERDFRFSSRKHYAKCICYRVCWVCGDPLGIHLAFVIGPMCAVNRTTEEPPSHRDCAIWSARFCPFLSRPHMIRREDALTRETAGNNAGCPLHRNPGVTAIWIARDYRIWADAKDKPLIEIGEPYEVLWFAEGREATRAEVEESLRTGLPALEVLAREQEGAEAALREQYAAALTLLPR